MISQDTLDIISRVVALRKIRGISQADLSRKINLSKGSLSQFERGLMRLSAENLGKIAKALDTSTDYLIFGKEKKNPKTTTMELFRKFLNNEKIKQMINLTNDEELNDLIQQMKDYLNQD